MNAMNLIKQLMASNNPQAMINNMAKTNPKIAQAIPIVEEIMKTSGSKKEAIQKACQKAGVNQEQVEKELKSIGIEM
jgi:hypothetical protein